MTPHNEKGMEGVTRISLPWPDKVLSPNTRLHWGRKARAVKSARETAFWLTWEAIGGRRPGWARAALTWEFCPPSKRRFDTDNLVSQHKAANDGIADALGIDDHLFVSTYRMGSPVKGGAVVVTVRRSA